MSIISFSVLDVLLVLNAEQIVQSFGLDPGEIPMLMGGVFTPGADDTIVRIAFEGDFDATENALTEKRQINYIGENAIQGQAFRDVLVIGSATSRQSQGLPIITPIPLTRQLAFETDNAALTIITFDYLKVRGNMMHRSNLEKLADRDRMHYNPPGGVAGHIMDGGLRRRMGDIPGGF